MRDTTGGKRSRWAALALVVAMHAGIVVVLVRLRLPSRPTEFGPLSLLLVPPIRQAQPPIRESSPVKAATAQQPLAISLSTPPTPSASAPSAPAAEAPQAIDWAEELDRTVTSRSTTAADAPAPSRRPALVAPHVPPPPVHYKGESSTAPNGETTVWLSENCYQVFGPLLTVPDTFAHAMIPEDELYPKIEHPSRRLVQGPARL